MQEQIYALAAELGDLYVHKRQLGEQLDLIEKAIANKHRDIEAAMRLRSRAKEGSNAATVPQSIDAASNGAAPAPAGGAELV